MAQLLFAHSSTCHRSCARLTADDACWRMAALGGPDLKTLYVTSARVGGNADEPHAGALLAIDVSTPGIPEPKFQG
jgi:sugar lactone lactonase YvrE